MIVPDSRPVHVAAAPGPGPSAAVLPVAANLPGAPAGVPRGDRGFAAALLASGDVAPDMLLRALALRRRHGGRIEDILLSRGIMTADALYAAMARYWGAPVVDPLRDAPDPRLVGRLGAAACLRDGLVPWRRVGPRTIVATAHPADFARAMPVLSARFGQVAMALAPARAIEDAVLAAHGPRLARQAEARVPAGQSCRGWDRGPAAAILLAGLLALALGLWIAPPAVLGLLVGWTVLTMAAGSGLKLAALMALRRPPVATPPDAVLGPPLPVVSVMVALYREAGIAARLVQRLERLDWPRDRLDVVLVVEERDSLTRAALDRAVLPPWMRVAVVPDGPLRTKPRALNFALDLCRGSLIGIYDAEDAPEPDQIRRVVAAFRASGPRVACLQGVLDFYNPRSNWVARLFTLEYGGWFRVILPGLARLGVPVPLGGTTLFLRRDVLESLGGWDAHNVTEDADLGIRLARHGWQTALVDTVTQEEACCRPWPWVRQRSRWIKGYMMTWAVHMRHPARLWRDLGPRGFLGFQVLFLGALTQFLMAPLLWAFWLVPLGVALPGTGAAWPAVAAVLVLTEAVNIAVAVAGLRRSGQALSPLWALAQHVYFPLATLAAYKALRELVVRPFWWDKTSHGHFDIPAGAVPGREAGTGCPAPRGTPPAPPAGTGRVSPFRAPAPHRGAHPRPEPVGPHPAFPP